MQEKVRWLSMKSINVVTVYRENRLWREEAWSSKGINFFSCVTMRLMTYSGDQQNDDESIGDLAPEDLVPLDTAIPLELVGTVGLETVGGLFGRETLEDGGIVVLCGLVNGEGVEGSLGLEINDFFTHIK